MSRSAVAMVLAVWAAPVSGQQVEPAAEPAKRVSVYEAAVALAERGGFSVVVAPGVQGEVVLEPDPADAFAALRAAAARVRCAAWQDEFGVVTISPTDKGADREPRRSFDLAGMTLERALLEVAAQTRVDVVARLEGLAGAPASIEAEAGRPAVLELLRAGHDRQQVAFVRGGVLVSARPLPPSRVRLRLAFDGHEAVEIMKMLAGISGLGMELDLAVGGEVGVLAQGVAGDRIVVAIASAVGAVVLRDEHGALLVRAVPADAEPVTLKVARATVADIAEVLAGGSRQAIVVSPELEALELFCHLEATPRPRAIAAVASACGAVVVDTGEGGVRIEPRR